MSYEVAWETLNLASVEVNTDKAVPSGSTKTQVPGLTATVTIPTGVSKVRVIMNGIYTSSSANTYASAFIMDGSPSSGTKLASSQYVPVTSGYQGLMYARKDLGVTPGDTHTFNVVVSGATSSTITVFGSVTPAMLTVEAVG